jgi:plasmid stabilization system protein ParE
MSSRRIFRTPDAIADLDGIWDYIARDNPTAADRLVDELAERFALLLKNPELGESQPLLADGSIAALHAVAMSSIIDQLPMVSLSSGCFTAHGIMNDCYKSINS